MNEPAAARLRTYLSRAGPSRAAVIRRDLSLTRSTFQRVVRACGDVLLVVGRARATTYAARRAIVEVPSTVPVFELDEQGRDRHLLTLHPVEPFGHYAEPHAADADAGFHHTDPRAADVGRVDLPWFLQDAAPSGFAGRAWLRAHAEQGYPNDLSRWSGDHVLRYAVHHGTDLPGALVVGRFALDRVREERHRTPIRKTDRVRRYPELATEVLGTGFGASSPGGEQPKFTVVSGAGVKLVKFSPPMDTAGGRRWADLLVAEHASSRSRVSIGMARLVVRA